MLFCPKLGRCVGKLRPITDEERAELDRRVAKGELYEIKRPPQEEIDRMYEIDKAYGMYDGMEELLQSITEEEIKKVKFSF